MFETEYATIGSLICFDSIYEQLVLDSARDGAEMLLVSSNDSWFYDSAAVYQHQAQSQLRAIECGLPIARSANTGISTIIDTDGSLLAWIDPLERGYAASEISPCESTTLYSTIGNTFVYLCILSLACLAGIGVWRRYGKKES